MKELRNLKIGIIGRGNVGSHLYNALKNVADCHLIDSRRLNEMAPGFDIALICVKDDAIEEVARKVKGKTALTAHTSGSVPLSTIENSAPMTGVFYPLQTFNKNLELDYSEIPFFIEGSNGDAEKILTDIAKAISEKTYIADSQKRTRMHLASVFACNFTNALTGAADDILKKAGMDYKVLLPLLSQTFNKLKETDPKKGQTGPAVRKDFKVMEKHMEILEDNPDLREIYKSISDLIMKNTEAVKI